MAQTCLTFEVAVVVFCVLVYMAILHNGYVSQICNVSAIFVEWQCQIYVQ